MNKNPSRVPARVSVILPVYNGALSLARSVGSVLNQTYGDLELLIVDDGSTDATRETAEHLCEADNRVKLISQKNAGVSVARNVGLAHATGEFVAFIDADDTMEAEMLAKMVEALRRDGTDLVRCGYNDGASRQASGGQVVEDTAILKGRELSDFGLSLGLGERKGQAVWMFLGRSDVFRQVAFARDVSIGEDVLYVMGVIGRSSSMSIIGEPLYNYEYLPGSAMNNPKTSLRWLESWPKFYAFTMSYLDDTNLVVDPVRLAHFRSREARQIAARILDVRWRAKRSREQFEEHIRTLREQPGFSDFYAELSSDVRLRYPWLGSVMWGRFAGAWHWAGVAGLVRETVHAARRLRRCFCPIPPR